MIISLLLLFVMVLSVSATFAADDVVAVDDDVIAVEEGEVTDDVLTVEDSPDELSEINVVTKDNFGDYFDETGKLTSDADELVFEGDFSELDISAITIAGDNPVKFTGNGATFKNVQFMISQSGVTIDGFNLVTDEDNQHSRLIWIISEDDIFNITLSNNNITFIAPGDDDAYAIFAGAEEAMGSAPIFGLDIINNNITYVGTNETKKNNVIRVNGNTYDEDYDFAPSDVITVQGNTFDIQMPSIPIGYDKITYASTPMSEGIVFYYCNNVKFIGNKVNIRYNKVGGDYDTINVVAVYSDYMVDLMEGPCQKIEIKDNKIIGAGHNSMYAIKVSADQFEVSGNEIEVSSEEYYTNGISVDGPASNGIVKNNNITLNAPTSKLTASYGIYAWQMYGAISNVTYESNNISVNSYLACAMEIAQPDSVIKNNNIFTSGNFTYGIAASIKPDSSKAIIENNIIICSGNNEGFGSGDPILKTGSAGISTLGSADIKNNKIASSCVGVISVGENENDFEVILENNTIGVFACGNLDNYAVKVTEIGMLAMTGNNITFVGKTDGQVVTNGVYIFETKAVVQNNEFDLVIPAADIIYGPAPTYEEKIIAEGIVFDYIEDLVFGNNNVTVSYGDIVGYFDTIRAIDISNSNFPEITENRINVKGNQYIYALKVSGNQFEIINNNITSTSNYYANGIDIESPASGIIVANNINVTAPNSAYPIYAGMNGQDLYVLIGYNNISGEAYYVVGVEIGGDEAILYKNNIEVKGNHTIGVGAYVNNLTVVENTIDSSASNEGDLPIWDNMGTDTTGIEVAKGNFTIIDNVVETTGYYAAVLGDNSGNITNNDLLSSNGAGNNAIIGLGNINATGNPETKNKYIKVILVADEFTKVYGSADQFIAKVLDENGQPVGNKTIKLIIDGVVYTTVSDFDGNAAFDIDLVPDEYGATVKFDGDSDYGFKSIVTMITVTKKPTAFTAPNKSLLVTATK